MIQILQRFMIENCFKVIFPVHFCYFLYSCAIFFNMFFHIYYCQSCFFSQQMHKRAPCGLPSTFLRTRALNKRAALPYWVWKCIVGTVRGFALLGSQVFVYKHWERQERERGGGCERDVGRERGLGGGCLILYLTQGLKNVQKEREEEEERGWHFPCWPFVMSSGPGGLGRAGLHREHNHRAGPRVSSHTNTLDGTWANTHTRTTSTCYVHSLMLRSFSQWVPWVPQCQMRV